MRFKELVEAFNSKVPYDVVSSTDSVFVSKATIGNRVIIFSGSTEDGVEWEISFRERQDDGDSFGATGSGSELQVFSMVLASLQELIDRYQPEVITFTADKETENDARANLYKRLVKRFSSSYETLVSPGHRSTAFTLTRKT